MVKFHTTTSSLNVSMSYELMDKAGNVVASAEGSGLFEGTLIVKKPILWWPIGMSDQPAYLYSLKVIKDYLQGDLMTVNLIKSLKYSLKKNYLFSLLLELLCWISCLLFPY